MRTFITEGGFIRLQTPVNSWTPYDRLVQGPIFNHCAHCKSWLIRNFPCRNCLSHRSTFQKAPFWVDENHFTASLWMRERNELNLANVKLVEMGASKILRFPPNIPLLLFDSILINLLKINRWKSQNIVTSLSILLLLKGSMEFFYLIKPRVFLLYVNDLPNTSSFLTFIYLLTSIFLAKTLVTLKQP